MHEAIEHVHLHSPNTLRTTESVRMRNAPKSSFIPYSSSSPDVTFVSTKDTTFFDKSPVHMTRPLYLERAVFVSAAPDFCTKTSVFNEEDGVIPQVIPTNFGLSASATSYVHWKVK